MRSEIETRYVQTEPASDRYRAGPGDCRFDGEGYFDEATAVPFDMVVQWAALIEAINL